MIWQDFSPNWLAKANTAWLALCALPWMFLCLRMSWLPFALMPPLDGQIKERQHRLRKYGYPGQSGIRGNQFSVLKLEWTVKAPLTHPSLDSRPRTHGPRFRLEGAWNSHSLPSELLISSFFSSFHTQQVAGVRSVTLPETLLFVSTLDGSLHAVSKQTGDIKWTLREGPYPWTHHWYYLITPIKLFIVYFFQILSFKYPFI